MATRPPRFSAPGTTSQGASAPRFGVAEAARRYDRERRDRDAKAFYNSGAWRAARAHILAKAPLCVDCLRGGRFVPATEVHHEIDLRADWALALRASNLTPLCRPHHNGRRRVAPPDPSPPPSGA
jgi:5-methylcytosine-specific restriction enzyme A